MATLSPTGISPTGDTFAPVQAEAGGDEFKLDSRAVLVLDNSAGSVSKAVTITSFFPSQPGIGPQDVIINVAAGEVEIAGNFGERVFKDGDGNVQLSYDDVTDFQVGVMIL